MKKLLTILILLVIVTTKVWADGEPISLISGFSAWDNTTYDKTNYKFTSKTNWGGMGNWISSDNPKRARLVVKTTEDADLNITVGYTDGVSFEKRLTTKNRYLKLDANRAIQNVNIQYAVDASSVDEGMSVTFTDISIDNSTEGSPIEVTKRSFIGAFQAEDEVTYTNKTMTTAGDWKGISYKTGEGAVTQASTIAVKTSSVTPKLKVAAYYNDGWSTEYFDLTAADKILKLDANRQIGTLQIQNQEGSSQNVVTFSEIYLDTPESPSYTSENAAKLNIKDNFTNGTYTVNQETESYKDLSANRLYVKFSAAVSAKFVVTYGTGESISTAEYYGSSSQEHSLILDNTKRISQIQITSGSDYTISEAYLDDNDGTLSAYALGENESALNPTAGTISQPVAWGNEATNPGLTFGAILGKAGDIITVYGTSESSHTIQFQTEETNWGKIEVNAEGQFSSGKFAYTLTNSTASLLRDANLFITGYGFTPEHVTLTTVGTGEYAAISDVSLSNFDNTDAKGGKQLYAGSNSNINAQDKKLVVTTTSAAKLTVAAYLVDVNDPLTDEVTSEGTAKTEYSVSLGSEDRKIKKIVITNNVEESVTYSSIALEDTAPSPVNLIVVNSDETTSLPFTLGVSTDWAKYSTVTAAQFATAKSGDVITVGVSNVSDGAQISLKDQSTGWPALEESTAYPSMETSATSYTYTLTATSAAKLKAAGLIVGGHDLTITSLTLTPSGAEATYHTLTITNPENGSIAVYPTSSDSKYEHGAQVTLTATANDSYEFSKWSDNATDNPYTITISADTNIGAAFTEATPADPNTLWEGEQAINWSANPGTSQQVTYTTGTHAAMNIADYLVFNITPTVTGIEWPQIQLNSLADGQPLLTHSSNTGITSETTQVKYILTQGMINDIVSNSGLVVNGIGFTLNSVKIAAGSGSTGYENAVWIGEKVFPTSWGTYQTINKATFANSVAGDILRVRVKEVSSGAQMSFSYTKYNTTTEKNDWEAISASSVDGTSVSLVLTDDILSKIRTATDEQSHTGLGDLHISGIGFTMTSVDLISGSDVKTLTSTVKRDTDDDWVWTSAEDPQFTINVANANNEAVDANVTLLVKTDKYEDFKTLNQNVNIAANSNQDITFTLSGDNKPTEAGFYRATFIVNDETVRAFNFGFNPTGISSPEDKQSDFDSYWAAAKAQLDAIPINASLTEIASKSGTNRKVYLVEMQSVPDGTSGDPVTIRGYYAEPTDGKRHPVIVTFQGYDSEYRPAGQDATPYCMSGDNADSDYAEFILSTRGQCVNNRTAAERVADGKGDFTNTYGDWFAYQFGNKDSYYYRGAYMDCVRAIQFMASRSTSDMDNLFAQGQSQGGAFTYAAAALSGYTFKAIAPAITFMGDFPDYFELANWPASVARANQGTMSDDDMYAFLSYFDTKNLATKVSCPVITSIGVQDNVCPPHTNIAPYNNVTTASDKKQIVYNAELQHATNSDWYTTYMGFFGNYKTESEQDDDPTTVWTGLVAFSGTNFDTNDVLNTNNEKILAGVEAKDTIYIYTTSVATEASYQLQYKVGTGWTWTELISGTSVPEIIKYAATAESALLIATRGLVISGSGYSINKISLHKFKETPLTAGETRTLWENADGTDVSWNEIGTQGATLGAILEVGEKILVTVKSASTTETDRQVCLRDANSEIVTGFSSFDEVTSYPYVAKFTLTSDYVNKLQNGFHISGTNTTVTKMELYKPLPDTRIEKNLYGEAAMDSTVSDGITIAAEKFVNISEDDVLMIYLSGTKATDFITLRETTNWTQLTSSYKEYMTAGQTVFTLTLNDVNVAKLKAGGLNLTGGNFTISKMTIKTNGEIPADEGGEEGGDDDDEPIIDEETGEADLSQLTAQNDTKTTLTQNEDGSITMTTTEPYCAAQIWFNDPEPVAGNVLKVELAESKVNVTVTVKYTDGTESQMSANTMVANARAMTRAVASARAATRGDSDSGTTVEVPLETGKEVQNIEVKNNVAGTITIKKMQVTTINVFTNGEANLSMLKPQSNATYDTAAHTLATTKGWTGATISPVAGENVSGKELLIEFADASKVKVAVKYRTDVEGPSTIMEKAAKTVRLALDNTKNIQEISIQPTEASIVTFTKIAVNSEESDDGTLKPGKTITLWESAAGETLSWNEVANQDASVGEILQEYDELLITISGVTEGCDWPKVFIRDASSEQAGNEVLLNDIGSFPYTVRIVLTGEMAQQLQEGFSICGDGVTVTKLQVYRPEAPKTGDIHLADLNYGYNSSYDKGTHTITTTARWAARGWEIGDKRYNDKNLITVKFEPVDFPVTLKMEYTTGIQTAQATSVGVPAGRTELLLEIPSGISKLNRVYIIYENPGSVKLTEASVTYQDKLKLSTAIEAFEAEGVIHDGRYDTDGWYNLRGMRIAEPKTSGIYIHGGKKVVIY